MKTADHDLLIRLDEKVDSLIKMMGDAKLERDDHEKSDSERFGRLHTRLDGMNKYAVSIAIVAGGIGTCVSYIWNKITGNS